MTRPLVSIIVPSFNQGQFIRATLESILSQDYQPIEVIVMDGGSKDGTVEVLREFAERYPELQWRSEPDGGPADAVNKGFAAARGVYAGIQSSDDVYRAGAIREAVDLLEQDPELGVVCADTSMIDADGQPLPADRPEPPFSQAALLSRRMVIHQSSAFFRLAPARALGGWSPNYFCCDTEMWLRLSFRTGIRKVDRLWSDRRVHVGQRDKEARKMSVDWARMIDECAELKAAPLELRRAAFAGKHLVRIDYNPGVSVFNSAWHAWLGVMACPAALRSLRNRSVLVPGSARVSRWLRARLADRRYQSASHAPRPLPTGAADRLRQDHPRLLELRRRYQGLDLPMARPTMWNAGYLDRDLDLAHFRGDNAYQWQFRNVGAQAAEKYGAYLRDLSQRDPLGLIRKLGEDGLFGCWTFDYAGWPPVSRDLLDSVNELYFLDRHTQLLQRPGLSVLDIGAGYGRLAHRGLAAAPHLKTWLCADAIPESTFLCEYYTGFRGCGERAQVLPLDELDLRLAGRTVDLAINVHSFSEMSLAAITGWLTRVAALEVPWLFIVPNDAQRLLSMEADGTRKPFDALVAQHGYDLAVSEPVFANVALRQFMGVTDHFLLFRRR